jgi:hypothetical protein
MNDQTTSESIDERLAEALALLAATAVRVASCGLARLPEVHRLQIQSAIDAERCALTVQCDLPNGEVRVLADGEGWLKPQVLFATELASQAGTTNPRDS